MANPGNTDSPDLRAILQKIAIDCISGRAELPPSLKLAPFKPGIPGRTFTVTFRI